MAKYHLYPYEPVFPEKFKGETIPIVFRSSWELEFAKHCDLLPSVLSWSYETISVPYRDPITNTQKIYIPDFFVEIAQKDGFSMHYVFEIKPMHEQMQEHARNQKDAALVARNRAKWAAATMWCDRHSAEFAVLNESDLYSWHSSKQPRVNGVKAFAPTTTTTKRNTNPAKKAASSAKPRTVRASSAVSKMKNRITKARTARTGTTRKVTKI